MIGYIQDNNAFISEYYVDPLDKFGLNNYFPRNKIADILKRNNEYIINNNKNKVGKLYKINQAQNINKEQSIYNFADVIYDLFLFNKDLEKLLKENSKEKLEGQKLYLINEKWLSEFKKMYLYEKICQNNLSKTNTFSFYNRNIIINAINNYYSNEINKNHEIYKYQFPFLLKDKENLNFNFQFDFKKQEGILSDQYSFINENILEKIISPEINKNEIIDCDYYINNNKKFIIKCKRKYILVGEINVINYSNSFIPEIILDYNSEIKINDHFALLKEAPNDIKTLLNLKGKKIETLQEINSQVILGKAYFLENSNIKNNNNNHANNNDTNNYIKILFNLYMNYEYINYKISNKKLDKEQFEICYIVNKNYINKLKDILKYNNFCSHKIKQKFDKYIKGTNSFNELLNNETFYNEVKNESSHIQFNEINKQIINDIKKDNNLTLINKENLKYNTELYYYNNFEIISDNLYKVLDELNISLDKEKMIKTKCLFGEKKFILYPNESNVNYLIISSMNYNYDLYNYDYVCDFIFFYANSVDLDDHIKQIQKNSLEKTISNLNFINNQANIFKESKNKLLCKAYKIKEEKSDSNLSKEIKEEIFILIKIYLFNKDLEFYIDKSTNNAGKQDYKNYIHQDICYLINKEWMSEYKKYYLYEDLYNYFEKVKILKKLDFHHLGKKYYNESEQNIKKIYEDIKNNTDFLKNYYNKQVIIIDEKLLKVKEVSSGIKGKNNNEIKYYDEFVLINSELYKDINNNKYKIIINEKNYAINQGKIIICLNYYPFYQILIGSLNNDNSFFPLNFINFIEGQASEKYFLKFKSFAYDSLIIELNKNNNKIKDKNQKEIGELHYLDENRKDNNEINNSENKKDVLHHLIELYYAFDYLNIHIKDEKKTIVSQENYFLINKEWINYLNKCYNFEELSKIICKNEKNEDLLKKYREPIIESGFDLNDINYIISQIPEELKNDIKKRDKTYDINSFKPFEKTIKDEKKEIYYYDECVLINETIKNILANINEINYKFDKDVNCLINVHNIYICYRLKNNTLISIGKTDENNILKINILIYIEDNSYYENILLDLIKKGKVPNNINQLKNEKQKVKFFYNSEQKKIGYSFILNKQNEENNSSSKIERNKKIENESKSQNQKEKQLEDMNQLVKEEMKSLLKFYVFNKKLIEHLEPSKCNNGIFFDNSTKYYLISDKFMNKFRSLYPVNEFISTLNYKYNNDLSNNIDSKINQLFDELSKTDIYKKCLDNLKNAQNLEANIFDIDYDIIKKEGILIMI